ncbi:hypothetical protein [Kalamiella sp. sgz302252]|uniref:hypothetical protein n=1 Tax=Pantoea sp. sgz302252 TaxID=3341827 RepID=UPI0036D26B5A
MMVKSFLNLFRGANSRLFAVFFCLLFAYLHANPMNGNSIRGVEQWINMTNSMFYGSNDFLFSYGPLYWLTGGTTTQFSQLTYWLSLAFMSSVAATFWFLLVKLTNSVQAWVAFIIVFFLYLNNLVFPSIFLLWPFLLVSYFEFAKKTPSDKKDFPCSIAMLVFLGLLTGAFFYIRFLYGMVSAATFGSYFLVKAINKKNLKAILFLVTAIIFAYFIVGLFVFHNVASLKSYIIINSQLNFGNAVDMTYDNVLPAKIYAAFLVIFIAINLFLLFHSPSMILTFSGLMLIFIKLGFGRADHYLNYFIIPIAVIAMVACFNARIRWFSVFAVSLASLLLISSVPVMPWFSIPKPFYTHEDFKKSPQERVANKYTQYILPDSVVEIIGKGSVDVYPYNNEFVFANHLNYKSRPLFQNYMTLTPGLDKLNQHYFESNDRPDFVIWHAGQTCYSETCNSFEGFDGKYALNEDPLTSTAIMLNYHVIENFIDKNNKPVMLLKANETQVSYQPERSLNFTAKFDTWIDVPSSLSGLTKIIPAFELSTYARLKNFLFRGDVLYVHYLLYSGDEKTYRLNVLNANSGVVASPLLNAFPYIGDRVKKIKFTVHSSNYFKPTFKYMWDHVPLAGIDAQSSYPGEVITTPEHEGNVQAANCEGYIEKVEFTNSANERQVAIYGWSKTPLPDAAAPDNIFIHNLDEKGKEYYVRTKQVVREDVAQHFKNNELRRTGFEVKYRLPAITGENNFGIVVMKGGDLFRCENLNYHYR